VAEFISAIDIYSSAPIPSVSRMTVPASPVNRVERQFVLRQAITVRNKVRNVRALNSGLYIAILFNS